MSDRNGTGAAERTSEVLESHLRLREEGDLEADIERNYHPEVTMLTPLGAFHGHDGVRECASQLYEAIQDPNSYEYSSIVCDDRVALLEWSAASGDMRITDGVDTFVIEDGLIRVQTIRYTVTFSDLSQALNTA